MKIFKKLNEIKENFKTFYNKRVGKAMLLISTCGLGLSLFSFKTIGSFSAYLSAFHIFSLLLASMSLALILFGADKVISEDIKINKGIIKESLVIFAIAILGIFLNSLLNYSSPFLISLNIIILICSGLGFHIAMSNILKQFDKRNEKEFEKLPLNISKSKNLEEEKELELTNYFKNK